MAKINNGEFRREAVHFAHERCGQSTRIGNHVSNRHLGQFLERR